MMLLSDLQTKTIVNVTDGKNIGSIIDVKVDNKGIIEALVIDPNKGLFKSFSKEEITIRWSEIAKIGEDVILVKKDL